MFIHVCIYLCIVLYVYIYLYMFIHEQFFTRERKIDTED